MAYNVIKINPLDLSPSKGVGIQVPFNGPTGLTAASANDITFSGGLPVQQIQLSSAPSGAASGDTLVIITECPDDVAIYNATVATI